MTGKEIMLKTLRFEQPDRPPHFEIMFELEQEALGLQFPDRNAWAGCSANEKERMIDRCMEIYGKIIEKYQWDALAVYWPWSDPDVLHSIDPMARMDIAEVKKRCHGQMALMGNTQCNLLQDGPKEAIRESALYCLEHTSPGGGYIFSTSNTIFPGMPLENYEYMVEVLHEFSLDSKIKNGGLK